MRPGRKTIYALVGMCFAALAVPFVPELAWVLAGALALVAGAVVAEAVALLRIHVRLERAPKTVLSLDEEEDVEMSFATDARAAVRMTVRQVWPGLIEERSSTRGGVCRPGEVVGLRFRVRAVERGTNALAAPFAAVTLWGWTERIVKAGEEAEISVLPNMRAVKRMHKELNAFVLRGLGTRMSPRLGKGREFDRLREYVTDDDFRDIAWKSSARHGKLIVREYRLDRSQDVLLCLDRGHRMAARTTRVTRVDHAVNAAVLISYICNRMEDRVGMLSFGADVERGLPQGKGAAHLRRLTQFVTGVRAEFIHTDYLALAAHVRRRIRTRALVLIMTSLPEQDEERTIVRAVGMLAGKHLPLVVVLSDPALRAAAGFLPSDKDELCRTLVARDVVNSRRETMQELRRLGAWVVDTRPGDAGIDSVNAYLEIKRRQLI
ncbi:MAG: DUF58 domain-containing protein [Planctomycetota bacterium]|jgi:uncharacterized protein (DUF58 family)